MCIELMLSSFVQQVSGSRPGKLFLCSLCRLRRLGMHHCLPAAVLQAWQ